MGARWILLIRASGNLERGKDICQKISRVSQEGAGSWIENVVKGGEAAIPLKDGCTEAEAIRQFYAVPGFVAAFSDNTNPEKYVILCKNSRCNQKIRIPKSKRGIVVTCPHCRGEFEVPAPTSLNSTWTGSFSEKDIQDIFGTRKTQSNGTQQQQSQPSNNYSRPTRKITVYRLTHRYKEFNFTGICNTLKDMGQVNFSLDGQAVGSLAKEPLEIPMDSIEHTLKCGLMDSYRIPAGDKDYRAYYFNNQLMIGFDPDPFREKLVEFIVNMFRGRGMRDRMLDSNNSTNSVMVRISPDHIRLIFPLKKTRGLKEWATGTREEKISFREIGLQLPPRSTLPDGYWEFIEDYVLDAVDRDEEADMERNGYSFKIRETHRLY